MQELLTVYGPLEVEEQASPNLDDMRQKFFRDQKKWRRDGEPALTAMSQALLDESVNNPEFISELQMMIAIRRLHMGDQLTPSEVAGIWRSTLVYDQHKAKEEPEKWYDAGPWQEAIRQVVEVMRMKDPEGRDMNARQERMNIHLWHEPVATNPFTRAAPEEIIMQALAPRFPNGINWLDIGSSMVEVPHQVLGKQEFPFDPVRIYKSVGSLAVRNAFLSQDPCLSEKVSKLLRRPPLVSNCVAVDLVDPYHEGGAGPEWARYALRLERELSNPRFMAKYDGLESLRPKNLTFVGMDFSSTSSVRQLDRQTGGMRFDLVTISTVQHELPEEQCKTMDEGAKAILSENGILLKKDFFRRPSGRKGKPAPDHLKFYPDWDGAGFYRTYIYDATNPGAGWQEIFRARNSRCIDLAPSFGRIMLHGEPKTISQLIEEAV